MLFLIVSLFGQGCHPSGRPWQVAVVQPPSLKELTNRLDKAKCDGQCGPVYTLTPYESKEEGVSSKKYIAVFDLSDGDAITTSGDSEKVVEREGKIYSHIINPSNGRMLEINDSTLALAVVVSKSCMVADALSTVRSIDNIHYHSLMNTIHIVIRSGCYMYGRSIFSASYVGTTQDTLSRASTRLLALLKIWPSGYSSFNTRCGAKRISKTKARET